MKTNRNTRRIRRYRIAFCTLVVAALALMEMWAVRFWQLETGKAAYQTEADSLWQGSVTGSELFLAGR